MKKGSSEVKKKGKGKKPKSPASSGSWTKSKISSAHLDALRRGGLLPSGWRRPGDEETPQPRAGERVIHLDVIKRGVSLPIHPFLRGLLCVYGIQLHHFTPNSILLISCFVTLCECWLGIFPHWGLFRRVFAVRRQSSEKGKPPAALGGIGLQTRAEFFNFKLLASVRGWRERWFYISDQSSAGQRYGLAEFSDAPPCRRKSWSHDMTEAEEQEADELLSKVELLRLPKGRALTGVDIMATWLKRRVQPLQARVEPMWKYTGVADPMRVSAEELSADELRAHVKALTHLTAEELEESTRSPPMLPLSEDAPIPKVIFVRRCSSNCSPAFLDSS